MRVDLPELLPLICPACRRQGERGLELSALSVELSLEVEPGLPSGAPDELLQGVLRCQGCGRRYPVIDGVPVLQRQLGDFLRTEVVSLLGRPLAPEIMALLVEPGPDDSPLTYAAEQQGAYLDSSWGDCAWPAPDGPASLFGYAALGNRLLARKDAPVERALELGCGAGRGLSCLARGAGLVVGLDRNPGLLRAARRLLRGEELSYPRRAIGRAYLPARIRPGAAAAPGVQLICADALEPPFAPAAFGRVAALNVLDVARSPRALLQQLHTLCAAGGELLLASPYAWRSGVVDEQERLGGSDPAAALRAEVTALGWLIEDEDLHVPWMLRRDARAASLYDVHWLRARRGSQEA